MQNCNEESETQGGILYVLKNVLCPLTTVVVGVAQ